MRALERAIAFCESTLSYGRAQEPPPDRKPVAVEALVEEVHETLALADSRIAWIAAIERGLTVDADPDQLFACCSIWRAMQCRRWRRGRRTIRRAIRSASPGGARARWW